MTDAPEAQFAAALAAFQAEMPHIGKDQRANAGQYGYSYADLTDITKAVYPLLAAHGLAWTASPTMTDHGFVLRSSLMHSAGHRETGEYPLPDPSKANAQALGSAITYARRYSFTSLTGVAPGGEDDDGAKAQEQEARSAAPRAPQPQQRQTPAIPAPVTAVRNRVKAAGERLGWTLGQIGDDFASENAGLTIPSASVEQLTAYAEDLEQRASAA